MFGGLPHVSRGEDFRGSSQTPRRVPNGYRVHSSQRPFSSQSARGTGFAPMRFGGTLRTSETAGTAGAGPEFRMGLHPASGSTRGDTGGWMPMATYSDNPFPIPLLNLGASDAHKTREQLIAELDVIRASPNLYQISMQQVADLHEDRKRLKQQAEELLSKNGQLKKELLEFPSKISQATERLKRLEEDHTRAQLELTSQRSKIQNLRRRMVEMQETFATATETIAELRAALAEAENKLREIPRLRASVRDFKVSLEKEQTEHMESKQAQHVEREQLTTAITSTREAYSNSVLELTTVKRQTAIAIKTKNEELKKVAEVSKVLKQEVKQAKVEQAVLKSEMAVVVEREEAVQKKIEFMEKPIDVLVRARKEIVKLHLEIKGREATINRQKLEHQHHMRVSTHLKLKIRELQGGQSSMDKKAKKRGSKDASQLAVPVEEGEDDDDGMAAVHARTFQQVVVLQDALKTKTKSLHAIRDEFSKHQKLMVKLQSQNDALTGQSVQWTTDRKGWADEMARVAGENDLLARENQDNKLSLAVAQSECASLRVAQKHLLKERNDDASEGSVEKELRTALEASRVAQLEVSTLTEQVRLLTEGMAEREQVIADAAVAKIRVELQAELAQRLESGMKMTFSRYEEDGSEEDEPAYLSVRQPSKSRQSTLESDPEAPETDRELEDVMTDLEDLMTDAED